MARITYTNDWGQSVVLGNSAPLLVTKFDGLGTARNRIHAQKAPFQDGETVVGTTLEPRWPVIEGAIIANDTQAYRDLLLRAFNTKLSGVLRYERGELVREVECIPEMLAFPSNYELPYQVFIINLYCPSPFWLDTVTESEQMSAWLGFFKFPLRLPTRMGAQGSVRMLHNAGDIETPVIIEFNGPAVNPKVVNLTTGEFIRVKRTLAEGDKLTINTAFGSKRVEINGQNAFNWIDLQSAFWQLKPGYNQVEYTADSGQKNATVQIQWRNRYLGV